MKIVAKVLKLRQRSEVDQNLSITGYYVDEEKWNMHEIDTDVSKVVDKLLEIAAEYTTRERDKDSFVLTEVETTGMRVMIGESQELTSSTVLVPKPSYLRRILFYKCTSQNTCNVVYEYRPRSQIIVYEGNLGVTGLDYDFAIVECSDLTRIVFPHDLIQSKVKAMEKTKKRRRRAKRKTKSAKKSSRKTTKKKSKKRSRKRTRR